MRNEIIKAIYFTVIIIVSMFVICLLSSCSATVKGNTHYEIEFECKGKLSADGKCIVSSDNEYIFQDSKGKDF